MQTRRHGAFAVLGFLVCAAASTYLPHLTAAGQQTGDEQMIREARARSNQAIAAHDVDAIARAWMDTVHVVSSTSDQAAGRDANKQRFSRQFANRPDTTYVRQPATIDSYAPWAVASERGEWIGTMD